MRKVDDPIRESLRVLVLQILWKENHPKNSSVVLGAPKDPVNLSQALQVLGANPETLKPVYPKPSRVWMRHAWKPTDDQSPFQEDLIIWEGWVPKRNIPHLQVIKRFSWWFRSEPKYPDPVWEEDLETAYDRWMTTLR